MLENLNYWPQAHLPKLPSISRYPNWPGLLGYAGPVRPKRMAEENARQLLGLLRKHSPCSRADLVRLSGLAAPTVSLAVASLHRQGLVSYIGAGASSGGRPPRLLQFRGEAGFVIAADIGVNNVRLVLADFNGHVLGRWTSDDFSDRSPHGVLSEIAAGVKHLVSEHNARAKVSFIVVGAPGITNVKAGSVVSAPTLPGWIDVPLARALEKKTSIRVVVENDVNLGALGESWKGTARGIADFVFIAIRSGVGAGIVVNGQLIHGSNWSAGEIGYLLVPGLPVDHIEARELGEIEQAIGGSGIENAWAKVCSKHGLNGRDSRLRATEILNRASAGDPLAVPLLERSAEILAFAITNISLVLNISLVVLGGEVGKNGALLKRTRHYIKRQTFSRPTLATSSLGDDAPIYGAVWLGLQLAESVGFKVAAAAD